MKPFEYSGFICNLLLEERLKFPSKIDSSRDWCRQFIEVGGAHAFDFGIESKIRAVDAISRRVKDVCHDDPVAIYRQSKNLAQFNFSVDTLKTTLPCRDWKIQ